MLGLGLGLGLNSDGFPQEKENIIDEVGQSLIIQCCS